MNKQLWNIRNVLLNLKWWVYWRIVEALGLTEWADHRWYEGRTRT